MGQDAATSHCVAVWYRFFARSWFPSVSRALIMGPITSWMAPRAKNPTNRYRLAAV